MLRFELYVALYLTIGAGYYLYHKQLIDETIVDRPIFAQRFVSLVFIFAWPAIWLMDVCWWLYYNIKAEFSRDE